MNQARAGGNEAARTLQKWMVDSDVGLDPQAFIISPENSIELANSIVGTDSHYHAGIAVGDTWTFPKPLSWIDPVPTYMSGQRYTSAHWFIDFRPQGTAEWIELPMDSGSNGTVTTGWPAEASIASMRGSQS